MKTSLAKKEDHLSQWFVVDASQFVLGRLAVRIANILRGRHKAIYTPHTDTGDFVVVLNADKIRVTGKKEEKTYMAYSGYMGGARYRTLAEYRQKRPEFILWHAVKGMLPKNRLADAMIKKLKIYTGTEHPHKAQNPKVLG